MSHLCSTKGSLAAVNADLGVVALPGNIMLERAALGKAGVLKENREAAENFGRTLAEVSSWADNQITAIEHVWGTVGTGGTTGLPEPQEVNERAVVRMSPAVGFAATTASSMKGTIKENAAEWYTDGEAS